MSDTQKRYRAVRNALKRMYPEDPRGNLARHLNTLASMISGIVGSQSTNLPGVAGKTSVEPDRSGKRANRESRVKRFSRWVDNDQVNHEVFFMPFAQILIAALAHSPLVLAIDGSVVGRGCVALVIGVIYQKRLLPLAWTIKEGKKGHFPEELHLELLERVKPLMPSGAQVTVVGDGEFDGIEYQALLSGWGWKYVSRTSATITVSWEDHTFTYQQMGEHISPGEDFIVPGALFTEKLYGPVLAIAWWRKDCEEPIYLVTNLDSPDEAYFYYQKRPGIEVV